MLLECVVDDIHHTYEDVDEFSGEGEIVGEKRMFC